MPGGGAGGRGGGGAGLTRDQPQAGRPVAPPAVRSSGAAPVVARRRSPWARLAPWLRGEPLHVPSHALVVHFPAALLPTSLLLDVVVRLDPSLGLGRAAALVLALGLAGGVVAGGTGLLDWAEMIPGPRRARVTRHLLVQVAALGAFALSLALRLGDVAGPAPVACLAASAVGFGLLAVGDHLGGLLVYRDGMRVRAGRR
jgi:uncharacterized membrane protein